VGSSGCQDDVCKDDGLRRSVSSRSQPRTPLDRASQEVEDEAVVTAAKKPKIPNRFGGKSRGFDALSSK